jgi:hypothetical protein
MCNLLKVKGLINAIFEPPKVQRHTKINIYSNLALPTLSRANGSESWRTKSKDKTITTANEITFMRTAKCTSMSYKRKEDILKKVKTEPILNNFFKM